MYAREDSCFGNATASGDNLLERVSRRIMNRLDQLEETVESLQLGKPKPSSAAVLQPGDTDEVMKQFRDQSVVCERISSKLSGVCNDMNEMKSLFSSLLNTHCICHMAENVGAIKSLLSTSTRQRDCSCNEVC